MGSQADPRGFVDSRPGGNFSNTRDLPPQDMVSANQSQYPGGYDYDEDQRQRFLGSIPGDAKLSQASLQSTDGSRGARDLEGMKDLNIRDNPRTNGGGGGKSSSQRICYACQKPLTGQFVRALETTFHLECFKCRVSIQTKRT